MLRIDNNGLAYLQCTLLVGFLFSIFIFVVVFC